MRLDAERVDRNAAFAETFEQAQHVGAMFRMLRLPAHIVVIDELGMRRGIARGVKGEIEHCLRVAHRARQAGFDRPLAVRSEEHPSELPSLNRNSYAAFGFPK